MSESRSLNLCFHFLVMFSTFATKGQWLAFGLLLPDLLVNPVTGSASKYAKHGSSCIKPKVFLIDMVNSDSPNLAIPS